MTTWTAVTKRSWFPVAALATVLLLGACGPQPSAGSSPAAAPPASPSATGESRGTDTVAIRVEKTGGFVPPQVLPARLPIVSIYGDGRVITEGPVPAIYPGPALPNLQESRISAADLDALITRAFDAGVGSSPDLGQPGVADAPTTRFTVTTEGGTKRLEAYALGHGDGTDGAATNNLTEEQKRNRQLLTDLLEALRDLPATLGAGAVTPPAPYQPESVAAIATPYAVEPAAGIPTPAAIAWPGPPLPGKRLTPDIDVGCVSAGGDEAKAVLAAAANANAATPWTSDGTSWSVLFRPLLPDEADCASLARHR